MDISKIRKKAKEKEQKPDVGPAIAPAEVPAERPSEKIEDVPEELPVAPVPSEEVPARETEGKKEDDQDGGEQEEGILELLTFSLAQEEFAFRVSEVEEIIRFQRITRLPTVPDYVCGITSLRGKIIPVIDLKKRLILRGAESGEQIAFAGENAVLDRDEKILILAGPNGLVGATIDRVMSVVRFPAKDLLGAPAHLSEEERRYIEGVVIFEKRFISVVRSADALDISAGIKGE